MFLGETSTGMFSITALVEPSITDIESVFSFAPYLVSVHELTETPQESVPT